LIWKIPVDGERMEGISALWQRLNRCNKPESKMEGDEGVKQGR